MYFCAHVSKNETCAQYYMVIMYKMHIKICAERRIGLANIDIFCVTFYNFYIPMKPVSKYETGARFMEPEYGRLGE